MTPAAYAWLVCRAVFELVRFDVVQAAWGFRGIQRPLARRLPHGHHNHEVERATCAALELATCLYWKPVRCLQRSICTVRLLREYGIAARLVIGYRPIPFLSHAWVEVDSRVVNDSPQYQKSLRVLYTT